MFIHGIVGTPNHFTEFVSMLPDTVSVYNMLLDGHGKTVRDFSVSSMKKWQAQVTSVVSKLAATHEKIYIVAHSMGTLLAIEQAVKNKKVCNLFLLSTPLRIFVRPKMLSNSVKVYFDKINPNDVQGIASKQSYGISQDKNLFHYIGWIPRYLELFSKIRETRKIIRLIDIECKVYLSAKDEMVSLRSSEYLGNNPNISLSMLERSGHYYYDTQDFEFLKSEFGQIIAKIK